MPIQIIEPRRLYLQIADQIRSMITVGEFPPGSRLPAERELAKRFGVSRPSMREALIALEVEGYVDVRPGSGILVTTPNGEAPGYVVLQKITNEDDSTMIAGSIETHVVPGLGIVYTASVQSIPQYQTAMRIESRMTSMKHGSGPEPEIRKYAGSSGP